MGNDNSFGNPMSNKPLNILKASLPFVPPNMQRGISYYIKIEEFNNMVRGFQEDNLSGLQACGIPAQARNGFNLQEYLSAITPYLSKSEQDLIKMVLNVVQALKVYNVYKELDPSVMSSMFNFNSDPPSNPNHESMSSNEETEDTDTVSDTPVPNTGENTEQWNNPDDSVRHNSNNPAGTENQGINIEALKNMLSPSQKAMFDTYSSLLNGNTAV